MEFSSRTMLEKRLAPVMELLRRQTLVEQLVDRTEDRAGLGADVLHRRHRTALAEALSRLHPADIAHLLEMLPPEERSVVWVSAPPETAGQVLAEVNDTVAEGLVAETNRDRLLAIGERLNPVDLALIEDILPGEVRSRLLSEMDEEDRSWLETTVTYPEDSVGHLMTRDVLVIDAHATVKDVLRYVRTLGDLPDNTDKIFVVDRKRHLVGALPLKALIIHSPKRPVAEVMSRDLVAFTPDEEAEDAGQAFQRYDLISAPVVDSRDRLLGRLTVDLLLDFLQEQAEEDAFLREGLRADTDLFGPVYASARSRWVWLSLNLLTAFIASRVIGVFEGSIEKLVALATLMPIVASVGGNTGNQTVALVVRGLALDQIHRGNLLYLAIKEMGIALINGLLWGSVMGLIAWLLYNNLELGLVMAGATLLNLLVAAAAGIGVPIGIERLGRDPALGSSVVLTFVTDSMGFFIFLGLATLVLIH
ncbi:MAG: magnesium transporter [Gammaproteobacteria bacterium]